MHTMQTSTKQENEMGPRTATESPLSSSLSPTVISLTKSTCTQVRAVNFTFKTTGSQMSELIEFGFISLKQAARA